MSEKRKEKILSALARNFSSKRAFDANSLYKVLMDISLRVDVSKKILDLGCGSGRILAPLAKLYPKKQFVGLDLSTRMLRDLSKRIKEENLKNVSMIKDDFNNGWVNDFNNDKFDLINFFQNIHFVDDLPGFVNRLLSILTDRGRVIVASTNHEQFYSLPYCKASSSVLKRELKRTPDEPRIIEEFDLKGFRLANRITVDVKRKFENESALQQWLSSKPFSVLAYLDEDKFDSWQKKFCEIENWKKEILVDKMVILTFERVN
jgi:SAM-dependent methyltransferase